MDFSFIDDWMEEQREKPLEKVGEGYRNVWVAAEVTDGALLPATLEAVGQARELADQIGVYVYAVIMGDGVASLGQNLVGYGADQVLVADNPVLAEYQSEIYVKVLADLVDDYRPEILLLPATPLGGDLAPRLAQRLDTGLISHCVRLSLDMSERLLLGTFAVLGGEVYHTMSCPVARPQMATLQPGCFPVPSASPFRSGDVHQVDVNPPAAGGRLTWIDRDAHVALPQMPLDRARVVVAAGRGMGDASGFALVAKLAEALRLQGVAGQDRGDVAVAGSRGAYDEGWIGEDQIVGVGGKLVAPDLYLACGISGDVYHCFGLQEARFIIAINHDENAPIMRLANVAIVGDAREIVTAMLDVLTG